MTREFFETQVAGFAQLKRFCDEQGLEECDDIVTAEQMDAALNRAITYCWLNWRELRDALGAIEEGAAWYRKEDDFDYRPVEAGEFERRKAAVREAADARDLWDRVKAEPQYADPEETQEIWESEEDFFIKAFKM